MMRRFALAACLLIGSAVGAAAQFIGSGNAGYPPGATQVSGSTTATTGGISNLAMAVAANKFTYLCGFSVSPGSATAAITLTVTLNQIGGSQGTWAVGAPITAAGTTGATLTVTFSPCLNGGAVNQSPLLSISALGTGGVNQSALMWGYMQ